MSKEQMVTRQITINGATLARNGVALMCPLALKDCTIQCAQMCVRKTGERYDYYCGQFHYIGTLVKD